LTAKQEKISTLVKTDCGDCDIKRINQELFNIYRLIIRMNIGTPNKRVYEIIIIALIDRSG